MMLADESRHPLDALIPDPAGKPPLCDEPEFAELLEGMVADAAPRMFAVVQEYGERVDARIAAWGMCRDGRADIIGLGGTVRLGVQVSENALRGFRFGSHITPRLVWVNLDAATPPDADEEPDITPMADCAAGPAGHDGGEGSHDDDDV